MHFLELTKEIFFAFSSTNTENYYVEMLKQNVNTLDDYSWNNPDHNYPQSEVFQL